MRNDLRDQLVDDLTPIVSSMALSSFSLLTPMWRSENLSNISVGCMKLWGLGAAVRRNYRSGPGRNRAVVIILHGLRPDDAGACGRFSARKLLPMVRAGSRWAESSRRNGDEIVENFSMQRRRIGHHVEHFAEDFSAKADRKSRRRRQDELKHDVGVLDRRCASPRRADRGPAREHVRPAAPLPVVASGGAAGGCRWWRCARGCPSPPT